MRLLLVFVVAVAVLGGCLSGGEGLTATETAVPDADRGDALTDSPPTAGPDESPRGTPSTSGSGPPRGTVSEDTVRYADLTPDQQAAVDAAFDRDIAFVPNTSYVDGEYHYEDGRGIRQYQYLLKNGSRYRLSWSAGKLYAQYLIRATPARNASGADAVALENVSADVRDELRAAIENGSYTAPFGKWQSLPEGLEGVTHVRHGGTIYEVQYVVGDYWAMELAVEPIDPDDSPTESPTPTGTQAPSDRGGAS